MAISTRRCRDTPHPSTPAVYSPQELLCVFNTPTAVCYLHMFSARQYLLHQELKQDKTDLASSSENKASSINSASKGSKLVFWRFFWASTFHWNKVEQKNHQIYKKNETRSPATVFSPNTCTTRSSQQANHFNSASLSFSACDCSKTGLNSEIATSSF